MNKREFYLKALEANTYLITAWNISCFSISGEGPEAWKENPYPYRLVALGNGYHFVNPDDITQLVKIDDAPPGAPLLMRNEAVVLEVGDVPNVTQQTLTTYGNLFANYILLVRPFKNKVPFMTGRFSTSKIEEIITPRLVDSPNLANFDSDNSSSLTTEALPSEEGDPLKAPITVDEYLDFFEGAYSLVAYTQLFTPANTRKTMTAPPGIAEARQKLVAQYKGRLHDRAVVAEIAKKLQEIDAAYLKGDRGEDFLTSKKSREIVRSRKYLMYGAETGIEEKVEVDLIERSLVEGWDVSKFPALNNALRAGSFNRGKLTELGGAAVKDLFRATGNLKIAVDDCGSTLGLPTFFVESQKQRMVGFTVIEDDGTNTKLTQDNVGSYLGRSIRMRTSMTCKGDVSDYCKVCLGDRLANNPTSLSMAVADYGSIFMAIFMSAAHSKGIQVARLDIKRQLM